ncbi:MAG: hypothetical protein EPO07_13035 [Verrucomicrobia bacterium]|nr:MAG: hypothetical protein EPO07_13035 [Verrucomicrobiota bacterium]
MKNKNQRSTCLAGFGIALAIAGLALLPSQGLAQEKGAQKLLKIQTVEDLQKVEAGDTIVMSCPKCKDTYTQVSEKSFKGVKADESKTVVIHLCSSCETKIVTKGTGKQAKDAVVHTCKACGSEEVNCCVMKKGSGPTPGMEKK